MVEAHEDVRRPGAEEGLAEERLAVRVRDARARRAVAVGERERVERGARAALVVLEERLVRVRGRGHDDHLRGATTSSVSGGGVRGGAVLSDGVSGVLGLGAPVGAAAAHRAPRRKVQVEHERGVVVFRVGDSDGLVVVVNVAV